MEISLGCSLKQDIELKVEIAMPYETIGDLELLSLHRIKNRIHSLGSDSLVRKKLIGELIRVNEEYKKETGNNWMCITPSGLDEAVLGTTEYLSSQMELGISTLDDQNYKAIFKKVLGEKLDGEVNIMKNWFVKNYDNILYKVDGKIPYSVVLKMRERFSTWALNNTNPFSEPIGELIEEVALSSGINSNDYDSYKDLWKDLK